MNKNWKVMLTAAGLMVLCLSVTMGPFLGGNVFDYFSDLDRNYNLSDIKRTACSIINGYIERTACSIINNYIEQTNGYNDFIFFNAYASASFSRLF